MKLLRLFSILEGSSLLLLLFIAVPLKRLLDFPEAVSIIGPIHGALFITFNVLLLWGLMTSRLNANQTLLGFIASLIPFGSFIYKAKVLNKADA
jgi:integral membrane protein